MKLGEVAHNRVENKFGGMADLPRTKTLFCRLFFVLEQTARTAA